MRAIVPAAAFAVILILSCGPAASTRETVTQATVERWMEQLSNWGRWGAGDQIGTVNLITPQKRKQAAALVSDGEAVSLARTAETTQAEDNPRPFGHRMLNTGAEPAAGQFVSDEYTVAYHGYAHTHMDALAHMSYQGKSYNGVEMAGVTAAGAPQLTVTSFKEGIFTKAVLLDIPHLKGVDWLEPGTPIYPEDLDAFEKKTGAKVEPGDVVFVYTGRWKRRDAQGPWDAAASAAGLHASAAPWLHARDIAMLGSDSASDVAPSGVDGVRQPIHQLMLVAMGTPLFDNCDLEALAAACRKRNRWEFLLTAGPLPVQGGTGSPINPIAIF
ncbi:MAG: cyclase family protein [Bryobacterales bacterium]|nr:cyclase family protein [Bryobacterales bacterium]